MSESLCQLTRETAISRQSKLGRHNTTSSTSNSTHSWRSWRQEHGLAAFSIGSPSILFTETALLAQLSVHGRRLFVGILSDSLKSRGCKLSFQFHRRAERTRGESSSLEKPVLEVDQTSWGGKGLCHAPWCFAVRPSKAKLGMLSHLMLTCWFLFAPYL